MIRFLLKQGFAKFGRRYDYDTSYMSQIADTSTSAALRLSVLPLMSQYQGPKKARAVWAGALLGSTLEGDCGPCAQLVLDVAQEAGAPAAALMLCVQGQAEKAGDVGLGFRFAQATIADGPELEALRGEIEDRFGASALIAASFAASTGRVYPVLKRGLGHGASCQRLSLRGEMIEVSPVK